MGGHGSHLPAPGARPLSSPAPAPGRDRWVPWLFAAFVVTQSVGSLVRPLVSYRALALGVPPASLGLLAASYSLVPLLVALRVGRMIDRGGEIRFIIAGSVAISIGAVAIAVAPSVLLIAVLLGGIGLGHLATVVGTQALVARASDAIVYDRRFGHLAFFGSLGQLIGPAVGGLIAGQATSDELTRALLVGGLLGIVAVPLLLGVRPPAVEPRSPAAGAAGTRLPLHSILRTPGVFRAIILGLTLVSAIDIVIVYLPALGQERGWSASLVGGLLAVRAGASMASRVFVGALAERFGRGPVIAGSMLLAAAALVALPLAPSVALTVAVMVAVGFGLGIGQPLTIAWVASQAPPGTRATVLSVRLMGNRVGQVVLPVAAGLVAGVAGVGGVLAAVGLALVASLAALAGGTGDGPRRDRSR